MHSKLQQDYFRRHGKYKKVHLWDVFYNPGMLFLFCLRKAQNYSGKSPLGVFYRLMLRRYQIRYGFQISARTQIDGGLFLSHWGAVVINPKTIIGKNCNLAQGVTIGQTNRGENKGVPVIGDNVWIGANAVIVGGITIGDNVLIAPNSYVNRNVESNSIVVGNPMTTKESANATDGYINNKV